MSERTTSNRRDAAPRIAFAGAHALRVRLGTSAAVLHVMMENGDTILIVEDDAGTRDAMAELLRDEGYRVVTAANGEDAVAAVEQDPPLLIVSDVHMPGGDGLQMVTKLRERAGAYIPVVLVSALDDQERRVAGLDLGADDFLRKPVDPDELFARIRVQLRHARRERELERRTVVDPLTGVLNRRGLYAVLRREIELVRRGNVPLSVLMVDIDRFKLLNDTHGHDVGDTALRQIAGHLSRAVRMADHVGRVGGDEFLIALPGASAEAAAGLAERIRGMRLSLFRASGGDLEVRMSVGAATLEPGEALEALIQRADRAMYKVKQTGEIPTIARE